jgi:N-acetylneuraminate synthase
LRCITTLKETFKCPIGYSTHCVGIITPVVAVALGAKVIEAHITLDRAMYGSDQAASLEVGGFKKMVEYIRVIESAMGDGVKTVTEAEETCKKKLRRTKDY